MNLDEILQSLFAQAGPRPDLGQTQPVSTFAGRVVNPGDTASSTMQRMPMGSGEGDLSGALQATAMQSLPMAFQAALPKLLAILGMGARPGMQPGPAAGNPRDVQWNLGEQQMQQKLPVAGRSFQTPTDVARAGAGEQLPTHGTAFPEVPRQPSSSGGLDFFNQLARALGIETAY